MFPFFAIFLNECSPHTGGDRGKAECGASAEGWRECPALALFELMGTIITAPMLFKRQPAALKPPAPQWPLSKPRASGAFVFLASSPRFFVLAVTFGIPGAGY